MKLKKILSIFIVAATLTSVLCMPTIYSNATAPDPSGLGLKDGEIYYIMNNGGRLLASSSDDPDDMVDVITWNPGAWQDAKVKWKIYKQSDGSFKLKSFSGTGRTMRAHTNSGIVEVEYDEDDSSVKFDISRVESGIYEGMYTIRCGDYYVSRYGNSDVELTSLAPTSYWTFMAVGKRDAGLYANNSSEDYWPYINPTNFLNDFLSYGYGAYYLENYERPQSIPQHLIENDITIFAGKSSQASVDFYKYDSGIETFMGSFTADYETSRSRQNQYYAYDLASNSLCLSRCIIYLGSYTGVTYNGYNLVDITYEKGAHYVLGIECSITDTQKATWLESFYEEIYTNKNIEDSVVEACREAAIPIDSVRTRGDGNQYLNF